MKQLTLLFYSIFLISCNQSVQTQSNTIQKSGKSSYATELIDNGFLKYADSSKIDSLKTQLTSSFDIYEDGNFKIAHIDAEELAEFSFDFFLPSLNRILAKRDINLSAQRLNDKENSFDALINGDRIQLYTQKDLDNNTFWDTASRNFFRKVNEILRTKNSDEQFYLLYGGNDLHAILLTDKQFSIIADYYKNEPKEIPYKP
ncbi:hypothetical protein OCK74_19695 [Chitinophagaceae bacterium LB-8]|uniref:Uncharacterized protein n=1 Tax=Paraflavisolibacter caeni TaxID=2982496 RepID=A0A9X2XY65_9BACT|nr:hypothetical protein [Paraflavisolibacter caeni]MCU7551355.1 hypothetical protein [Paraflavisolibacter caeni]